MDITPIKTRSIKPPQDDLYKILDKYCPKLKDKDVLLITSKILAIHQGKCLLEKEIKDKDKLVKKEADHYIPRAKCPGQYVILTVKENMMVGSAGIDESNANGYYVLLPKNPTAEAKKIWQYLKKKFNLKKLGIIITDSHTTPLRYGTMGISIGAYGINPLKDYRGKKDIFGREFKMSQSNVVDALAVMGVQAMGEGSEQTPMAIIRDANFVDFTNKDIYDKIKVPIKEDVYYSLLKNFFKK